MIPGEDDLRARVKELRTRLGLTQAAAAEQAGVSQSFVAKLENGTQSPGYAAAACLYNTLAEMDRADDVTAAALCSRDVVSVAADAAVGEASAVMKEHGFSQLPVMENGVCIGSVSSRALLDADTGEPVRARMGPAFPQVSPRTSRAAVIELLRSADGVLVRGEDGIEGIVTASDIL